MNGSARLLEALRPFAVYADYMGKRWTHRNDSAHYGTKNGPNVTYGDWRQAARVFKEFSKMSVVLLPWVHKMSWKCQSILQGGFRGPDDGHHPAIKKVNRWLRIMSQQNADPSKPYMQQDGLPTDYELCQELAYCTCHYAHHLADALRCVSIFHPESGIRNRAWEYHFRIAEELFHFLPESEERFVARHVDKVEHD